VSLFDSELEVLKEVTLSPGCRFVLLDLDRVPGSKPELLAAGGRTGPLGVAKNCLSLVVEGVADTSGIVLLGGIKRPPQSVALAGEDLKTFDYSRSEHLLWIRFRHEPNPRQLTVRF
jgi:hypothetical protein